MDEHLRSLGLSVVFFSTAPRFWPLQVHRWIDKGVFPGGPKSTPAGLVRSRPCPEPDFLRPDPSKTGPNTNPGGGKDSLSIHR